MSIRVDGSDFSLLYKQVQKVDGELTKTLRKRLTREANVVRDEVREAALGIPSKGGQAAKYRKKKGVSGGAGLRQGIAAATETKIATSRPGKFSIRIRVSGTKFEAATGKYLTLPRYMEGMSRRREWRHPVFGNSEVWVAQSSHKFLLPTAMRHKARVVNEVRQAFQDAANTVFAQGLRGK